jgi:2-hydroxy-3-oxopropionate reductase
MTYPGSVGFVGLGGMGSGLVKNLLAQSVPVTVLDKRPEVVATALGRGARAAQSLDELAETCDVIMVCVNNADDSESVILGVLDHLGVGKIVVEHTTTNPESIARLDAAVRATGAEFAEAPMTRTPLHADRGEVNILYGGPADLLDKLRPLFDCYAENVFHVGPLTHAIKLKLIHTHRLCQRGIVVRGLCSCRQGRPRYDPSDRHHLGGWRQERHDGSLWPLDAAARFRAVDVPRKRH